MHCSPTEFICNIHDIYYECVGHPSTLYSGVMFIAALLCFCYILAGVLALGWLASAKCKRLLRSQTHFPPTGTVLGTGDTIKMKPDDGKNKFCRSQVKYETRAK